MAACQLGNKLAGGHFLFALGVLMRRERKRGMKRPKAGLKSVISK